MFPSRGRDSQNGVIPTVGDVEPVVVNCDSRVEQVNEALLKDNIHVMHHAGRIRIAVHGYNTQEDVNQLLAGLRAAVG